MQKTFHSSLAMHKNSQITPKEKSKIRIIHIFAPQIIKTDVANFRELVQRLTGKPTDDEKNTKNPKAVIEQESRNNKKFHSNKIKGSFHAQGFTEKIKGEEEIWRDANTGGGFLGGFSEFDHDHGFLQDQINYHQFPFVGKTNQMDVFEESQVA